MKFHDRTYAAFLLADELKAYKNTNSIVLAVPRGGVPIGYQLSKLLNLPLDIILCKKIGHPQNPEYAIGAVSPYEVFLDEHPDEVSDSYLQKEIDRIQNLLREQQKIFQPNQSPLDVEGKTVILTDDGIATGRTLAACVLSIKKRNPEKVIIATPVASKSAVAELTPKVDEIFCVTTPHDFHAIGQFYEYFPQVSNEDVRKLLAKAKLESSIVSS